MGSLARTIHSTASLSTSTMKIVLAFCLVAAFACTAESRSHGKINVLLKMMEKTLALNKDVSEGRAEILPSGTLLTATWTAEMASSTGAQQAASAALTRRAMAMMETGPAVSSPTTSAPL